MPSDSASPAAELIAEHVLDFPGGYTRSVGPVIGRFLGGLASRQILGVKTQDGRVLVPPTEYDPDNGKPVTGDFIDVGPGGTVVSWTWIPRPTSRHPFQRPFAYAIIKLDGADTGLLHVLDLGEHDVGAEPPRTLKTGMRVRATWGADGVGGIRDLAAFVPETAMITTSDPLLYRFRPGRSLSRFLDAIATGQFIGGRCQTCGKVYVPLRDTCPADGVPITDEVALPDTGTVTTFAVNNIPDPRAPEVPFVSAYILLDGADLGMLALVAGIPADQVRMGMRVRAKWADELGPTMASIRWFEPSGEPDASFDSIKEYT